MKKKETRDIQFIKQPYYQGGQEAITEFVRKKLEYPESALKNKIEGTVVLRYDINHKGKVTDAKVLSSLGHGCDEEAMRIIKQLEFTAPKNRGGKVVFHKTIQIHFKLPAELSKPQTINHSEQGMQISYKFTPSGIIPDLTKKETGNSYHYTITVA